MTCHRLAHHVVEKPWGRTDVPARYGATPGQRIGEVWFTAPDDMPQPLLIKYLFTSERLSIQVHPNDRHAKGRRQRPRNVGIRPTGLGRGQDMTIGRGLRMNVDRPEGCKTKSRKPPLRLPLSQDRQDRRQCFVRCGRGNGLLVQNGARRRRQRTDALGATQFDTSKRAAVRMIS